MHSPLQLPSPSSVSHVPSHCPEQVPEQVAVTVASHAPVQDPEQEPLQEALASTEQDPEQEPEQLPLSIPPVHVGGVAVASKLRSHSAVQSMITCAATLQTPGMISRPTTTETLAAKAASIAALAFAQAIAVSSEAAAPRSVAIALQASRTPWSSSLEVTPKRALASSSASSWPLSKVALTSFAKLRSQLPMFVGSVVSQAAPATAIRASTARRLIRLFVFIDWSLQPAYRRAASRRQSQGVPSRCRLRSSASTGAHVILLLPICSLMASLPTKLLSRAATS